MMTDDQLKAIEARAEAAFRVVCEVCKSPSRNWRMSIPVNEERDSDRILSRSVNDDIPALVAEVRRLRGQVDALADLVEWTQDHYAYKHPSWDLSLAKEKLNAILNGAGSEGA